MPRPVPQLTLSAPQQTSPAEAKPSRLRSARSRLHSDHLTSENFQNAVPPGTAFLFAPSSIVWNRVFIHGSKDGKPMAQIEFSHEERTGFAETIKDHLDAEFGLELGSFEAEELFDFLLKAFGSAIYNRALYDAGAIVSRKSEEISEAILGLER
ncbi:MAG: hypothetical protein CMK09_00680 [Ponticaulis sp.]|nr:hypothetical protein [Ponticaulis sp.]